MEKKPRSIGFTIHNIVCIIGAVFMVLLAISLAYDCYMVDRFAYSLPPQYNQIGLLEIKSLKTDCIIMVFCNIAFLIAQIACMKERIDHPIRLIASILYCLLLSYLIYLVCKTLFVPIQFFILYEWSIFAFGELFMIFVYLICTPLYHWSNSRKNKLDLSLRYNCVSCGSYSKEPVAKCPKCGEIIPYVDRYKEYAVSPDKRFRCAKCGESYPERHDQCPKCRTSGSMIEQPTIPFVSDNDKGPDAFPHVEAGIKVTEPQETSGVTYDVVPEDGGSAAMSEQELHAFANKRVEQPLLFAEPSDSQILFCRECGTKLSPDALFCPECGTKIEKPERVQNQHAGPESIKPVTGANTDDSLTGVSNPVEPVPDKDSVILSNEYDFRKDLPPTLRRAFILIEDEEWDKADSYFEKMLDLEPENAYAYIGKLLAAKHISHIGDLSTVDDLTKNKLFLRGLRYADGELKDILKSYCK